MVDSLLQGLFGGDDGDQRRGQARDFVSRYEQGPPHEGFTDDEAIGNYRAAAGQLSPQEFEDSAAEAYEKLSPDERDQFAQWLQERSGGQNVSSDPRDLARMTSQVQNQNDDGLLGMLGGGGGGLGGMLGGALGGGQSQGGMSGIMNSPIGRAAIGGIAAMAMKRVLSR